MQEQLIKPNVKALAWAIKQAATGGCGSTMLGHLFVIVQVKEITAGHLPTTCDAGINVQSCNAPNSKTCSRLLDQGCWIKAAGSWLLYKPKGPLLHSQNQQIATCQQPGMLHMVRWPGANV